ESLATLVETGSNNSLKQGLRKISNYIHDGRSLQEAFENARIFPKIVYVSLAAAEKTGNISDFLDVLAGYYKFKADNAKKVIKSLIYPAVVFVLLSGLSIFISISLVPQLKTFLPQSATHSLSAVILIGYADFIKIYWWVALLFLTGAVVFIKYAWDHHREKLMKDIFHVPILGYLIKTHEFSHLFLSFYVYQRSGVNIIETLTHIHQAHKTYITDKLLLIRDKVFKGAALADAFSQDKFFPAFVSQNLAKGEKSGYLAEYFERIYRYYDIKTKEAITSMISFIEPSLLILSALFLFMIVCAFILPIYTNINQIGSGVFR
ncbi:MAG: type II secretion system F family protein, partial [Candidatus Omnitrophica bacterium]|nr:type II secretion system F family protein [Candidatus Omnitrophota bacterium]